MIQQRQLENWFIKTWHETPWWKMIIWMALGVKRVGENSGYRVTMYYFRGIYLVTRIEGAEEHELSQGK